MCVKDAVCRKTYKLAQADTVDSLLTKPFISKLEVVAHNPWKTCKNPWVNFVPMAVLILA